MSMSSGYSSSAIRERIYFGDDMSGVLLYTGSADKEGSLGGLVELGNIDQLIVLMKDAFQEALVCTNDSLLDELEMRWEDEQKLNGLSSVHSMGFRQFIFYLAHKVDFIAEIFLCTMILFGNVGAQPAASFLLKFASFAKFLKQPESLCCFCTNQIFNFFSCNTAVFQCILKNE